MKPCQLLGAWAIVVLLCVAAAPAPGADAACDATQLTPCAGAIIGGAAPTATCCSRLKEQQACLCEYARDPNLQRFVNSANGKKLLAACDVPVPTC